MKTLFKSEISKEILVTIALLTFFHLASRIQLPYINLESFYPFSENGGTNFAPDFKGMFSIFSLGLMPYVSSCLLVEIGALTIPFLKKHHHGDYDGRKVLKGYALLLTLVLGIVQSWAIISGMKTMNMPSGGLLLQSAGFLEHFVLVLILVSCLFLLIFITEIITLYGIGNGISMIILSGICAGTLDSFTSTLDLYSRSFNNAFHEIIFSLAMLFFFIAIPMYLVKSSAGLDIRHKFHDVKSSFRMNLCPSGKVILGFVSTIMMLPITLFSIFGNDGALADMYGDMFFYGSPLYNFLTILVIIFLSYLFAWLFLYPEKRLNKLNEWGWFFEENNSNMIPLLKKKLRFTNLFWTLFLCAMILASRISLDIFDQPIYLGGTSIFIAGILCMDIFDRVNLWQRGEDEKLHKIAELHDVYYARMIKDHLKSENIRFHLQGYYHRHLLYFFGPYIPINLKVVKADIGRASEIVEKFYGRLGLPKI